jgi:AcrR family transcriptional regulator
MASISENTTIEEPDKRSNITRNRILNTAQEVFAESGYTKATIRTIAKRAGVDPGLVMHYFPTKQQLFTRAMAPLLQMPERIPGILAGDTDSIGMAIAALFIGTFREKATRQILIGLIRASSSEPVAAEILRDTIAIPILRLFNSSNKFDYPELRASLISSQLIGLVTMRYIIKSPPLIAASPDQLIVYIAPTLQHYLTGNIINGT